MSKSGWQVSLDEHPHVVTYARGRWRVRKVARTAAAEAIGRRPVIVSVVHRQPPRSAQRVGAEPR